MAATYLVFGLFLLANAILYVRPTEYLGDVVGAQAFLALMVLCLLLGFPAILGLFAPGALASRPMLLLPLLFWPLIAISDLGHGRPGEAVTGFLDFARVVPYYLLILALITTADRLRQFLFWLPVFAFLITLLAVLQYHEIIQFSLFKQLEDNGLKRLQATGIFRDPNDLGALIVVAVLCCLFFLTRGALLAAPLWMAMIGVFVYAIYLTHSRGTLLALGAGVFFLLRARIGTFSALLLGTLLVPGLFLFNTRSIELGSENSTAMTRVGHWSDAMVELTASPLFGTGYNNLHEEIGLVAHNSYLHAFAELGLLGGCVFLGMFIWPLWRLLAMTAKPRTIVDRDLAALHPTMLAILAAYMVSIFSLSLCYVHPTYTVLGLVAAFLHMTTTQPPMPKPRINDRFFLWLGLLGALFLVFMKGFIPVMRLLGG